MWWDFTGDIIDIFNNSYVCIYIYIFPIKLIITDEYFNTDFNLINNDCKKIETINVKKSMSVKR